MKLGSEHKKEKCPKCGSKEILNLGFDQMCCDCDWDNSRLLVELGQLDNIFEAIRQQFGDDKHFNHSTEHEQTTDLKIARRDLAPGRQRIA